MAIFVPYRSSSCSRITGFVLGKAFVCVSSGVPSLALVALANSACLQHNTAWGLYTPPGCEPGNELSALKIWAKDTFASAEAQHGY